MEAPESQPPLPGTASFLTGDGAQDPRTRLPDKEGSCPQAQPAAGLAARLQVEVTVLRAFAVCSAGPSRQSLQTPW